MISMIAAMTENRVIGQGKEIPWDLSGEETQFKTLTSGHTVIMGRKTFEALGGRPLPNRRNIIVTRSSAPPAPNCEVAHSFFEAITMAEKGDGEIYIGGGETIYEEALPFTDRLYLTIYHDDIEGDAYFPRFSMEDFTVLERQSVEGPKPYTRLTLQRKSREKLKN